MLAGVLALVARATRPLAYSIVAAITAVVLAIALSHAGGPHALPGPISRSAPTSDAEQYTYSAVWLAFGVVLLAAGIALRSQPARLASAAVVA